MDKENISKKSVEIEMSQGNIKAFIKLFFDPLEIWIDFNGLPKEAFLCAGHDNETILKSYCGANGDLERFFVRSDWVINEWGGDKEIVNAIKSKVNGLKEKAPMIYEKHKFELSNNN